MRILVVGGVGYVGSVLARELLDRGYAVRVFDRLFYGRSGLREISDKVELVVGDLRQLDRRILADVDAVINVSGLSNDPTADYNPSANFGMNVLAAERLAQTCKRVGISRHIYASSCSIYDFGVIDQEHDVLLDEEAEVTPRAAYSCSKYEGERRILALADQSFCPVLLRKGTVYGFSPRMRYDLVVNSFVKDALSRGVIHLHCGGEMWRPLVSVRDAARAYIACLEAPEDLVKGQVFNVVYQNFRIAELGLRVREALRSVGVSADIHADYQYRGVRNYRVSGKKIERVLGFTPLVSVEEAVREMVGCIRAFGCENFDHPIYYNIQWIQLLEEAKEIIDVTGSVLTLMDDPESTLRVVSTKGP